MGQKRNLQEWGFSLPASEYVFWHMWLFMFKYYDKLAILVKFTGFNLWFALH